ncbi:hypothetical protein B0J13DRAFT_181935 [Dactylonectria estremocensis]|uniref:Uncharacterized protein n=1 Tax=Dactylonectria estremocensis TaxID=1079267 RepID=A0A9P9FD73_9HYPO|nr:hypothetical protein B0J13DRAFT_181935 [Dactylonectria estremocensis]
MHCLFENLDQVDHSIMPPPTPPDSVTNFPHLTLGSRPALTGLVPRPDPPRRVPLGYLDVITPPGGAQAADLLTNPLETRGNGCSGHQYRNTDSRAFCLSMRSRSYRHLNRVPTDADNAISGNTAPKDRVSDDSNASEEILSDGSSDALVALPKHAPIEDKAYKTHSEQAQQTRPSRAGTLSNAWLAFLNRNRDKDEAHANDAEGSESEAGKRGTGLLSFERRTRIERWRQGCVHGATMEYKEWHRD